jgi:hypothetical protein
MTQPSGVVNLGIFLAIAIGAALFEKIYDPKDFTFRVRVCFDFMLLVLGSCLANVLLG